MRLSNDMDSLAHARSTRAHRGDLDASSALERFLIAVPVSAFMLAGLRSVTASYARHRIANAPVRAEDKEVREPDEVAPDS